MSNISNLVTLTMTSLELVEFINSSRAEGESELRHDNFMAKVPKVLGEFHAPKFSGTQAYGNSNTRAIYNFPKREACLMAMSYSYELQAKVFDRMTELESKQTQPQPVKLFANPATQELANQLDIMSLLGVPLHLAQVEAVKEVRLTMGADFSKALKLAPAQQNIPEDEVSLEPTELGKLIGLSPIDMNKALATAGFQTKVGSAWEATPAGKPFASRHQWTVGGKSGYNLKWKQGVLKLFTN